MNESVENKETKECPYCAETILKKAKKCRYCSSVIENSFSDTGNNTHEAGGIPAGFQIIKKRFWLKWMLAAVILLVISVGYKVYKEAEDRNDYKLAKRSDTKESWEKYIEKHADGDYVALAVSRIDQKITENIKDKKACDLAQTRNSDESWEFYVRKFPDGKCIPEDHERIIFVERERQRIAEELRKELAKWSKKSPEEMTWNDAIAYCKNLDESGYSDWRLPTISELRKLIKNCPGTETGGECQVTDECLFYDKCYNFACDDDDCSGWQDGRYSKLGDIEDLWSSSALSDDTDTAWHVNFYDVRVGFAVKTYSSFARCVR